MTSTPLDSTCMTLWAPGGQSRHDAFISSTRSFLTLLGRSWTSWVPPCTTTSPPGSSGSSPGLSGEFSQFLRFERLCLSSDTFCSFLSFFPMSLMVSDAADASALAPGWFGSTWTPSGEFSSSIGFKHSWPCIDAFCRFFGRFSSSSTCLDTPIVFASSLVSLTSQLADTFLSPSSSMLRGSSRRCIGLLGGGGGSGGSSGMSSLSCEVR